MIIPVKKYIFIGVNEDLKVFFERAQKKGFIEFINPAGKRTRELPDEQQKMVKALKILRKLPAVKQAELVKDLDPFKLADSVVKNKEWLEKLQEDERLLQAEIARLIPLGDFSIDEMREIEREGKKHIQFFCVKRSKAKKITVPDELIYLSTEYDMDYYMSVSEKVESFPGMIEMHVEKSLSHLERELTYVHKSLKNCEKELKENSAYLDYLKEHLVHQLNHYQLTFAQDEVDTHMNDSLFAVEAWVPKNRLHGLFPLLEGLGIHAEEIAIEKTDRVPTYMENSGFGKVGEDLVHIYDTPAADDKDPSTWVFWAFAVFYAMIISDAGYGFIYLALALFLKKKFSTARASVKRVIRLLTVLSISIIVWGVLAGSYFGIYVQPKSPVNKASLIHILAVKKSEYIIKHQDETYQENIELFPQLRGITAGEEFLQKGTKIEPGGRVKYAVYDEFRDSIFMEIALLVGVMHICLSLLRQSLRNYAGVGWVFAIIGGYLYFPQILGATSIIHFMHWIPKHTAFEVGFQLLCGGVGLAIVLAMIQHRLKGLVEITKPIEIFADILSYLRLYALGLAGMILAETFNGMGERLGFAAGFFVILLGHTTNLAVGMIGGTIHGLRLNFIEWYHHCFSGGGKIFNPLKLLKVRGE